MHHIELDHYCEILNCNRNGEKAHLISRGALPKELHSHPDYFVYLCRRHHCEQHSIGIETFCKKYGLEYALDRARKSLYLFKTLRTNPSNKKKKKTITQDSIYTS